MSNAVSDPNQGLEFFTLRNFPLQCGLTLPEAKVAYKTYGTLAADRSNVILYPTSYAAFHSDIEWLIAADKILDPTRYFILLPCMFGNGQSTSPSNLPEPFGGGRLPKFSHVDNVTAQRRLLSEVFGIERLKLIYGWSMGGQQALHWGALFPNAVERIAALCTSAKTSENNIVFLESLRAALTSDPAWQGDRFVGRPERGLRAYGRIYAGWAISPQFYREQVYRTLGYSSLEDFLVREWEANFLRRDAANLLSMLDTWQRSDVGANDVYQGDWQAALRAIQARTLIMPGSHDRYFLPEESETESRLIPRAVFRPIPSIWGHRAGNPARNPVDMQCIRAAVAELLAT